jgi:putative membrane protein
LFGFLFHLAPYWHGFFIQWKKIGENSENPFKGGANDVPITDLSRSIEIDIRQLIDDTDIPKAYEWKNNIVT